MSRHFTARTTWEEPPENPHFEDCPAFSDENARCRCRQIRKDMAADRADFIIKDKKEND